MRLVLEKIAPLLRTAGHEVHTPTLIGVGERAHLHYPNIDMHTHIQDVVNILDADYFGRIILPLPGLGPLPTQASVSST